MLAAKGAAPGLFSGSVANFLGLSLPLLLGAYSIPLIISRLGVERFGTLTLVWALIGYVSLLDFGISRALTKRVAELGDSAAVGSTVRAGLILMLGIGFVLGGVVVVAAALAESAGMLNASTEMRNTTWLISGSMPLVLLGLAQRGILEGRQRFVATNWGRVILGVAAFGAPIPLLTFNLGIDAMVAALVFGRLLMVLMQGWACRRELTAARQATTGKSEIMSLLRFGGWMMLANLVSPIMVYVDRFLIGASVHSPSVAFYTTPFEVVTRLLILPGAVATTLFPRFAQWGADSQSAVQAMVRGMGLALMLVLPLVLALELFANEVLQIWLGAAFADKAALPMQILAWGVLFNSLAHFPFSYLQGMGRPKWVAILLLAELPVYLIVLFVCLHIWGIVGVAAAWTLRMMADVILLSVLAGRLASAQQNRRTIQMIAIAMVVGGLALLPDMNGMAKLGVWFCCVSLTTIMAWKIIREKA